MMYTHIAAAALSAAIAATGAWQVQGWRFDAKDKQRAEAQAELQRNQRKAVDVAATGFENDRTKNEIRTRTIRVEVEKIVDRPVYRSACFDDDGLRALNATIRRTDDSGQSGFKLPRPAAGG